MIPCADHSRNEKLEPQRLRKKIRIDSVVLRCVAGDPTDPPVPLLSVWYGLCSQYHGLVSADLGDKLRGRKLFMSDASGVNLSTTWRDDAQPALDQLWGEIESRFGIC